MGSTRDIGTMKDIVLWVLVAAVFLAPVGCSKSPEQKRLAAAQASARGQAARAGVSLYKLAQWLGHSDVRTTQIYAHLQAGYNGKIEKAAPPNGPGERG